MPTVVIAEDHQLMVEGYILLIDQMPNLSIAEIASDGKEALEAIEKHNPDLLILDLHMPRLNGLEVLRHLSNRHCRTKVIVISMYSEAAIYKEVIELGASAYIDKNTDQEEFAFAIQKVLKGSTYFNAELSTSQNSKDEDTFSSRIIPLRSLSKREEEILKLISKGLTNKEIADTLFLSPKTVDNHRTNLMKKLGVHNVTALVRYAITNGYDIK